LIKRCIYYLINFNILLYLTIGVRVLDAQELDINASAYEIMESVDKQITINWGLNKVQLTITSKKGNISVYKVSHFKKDENAILYFDSQTRGRVLKVLYNDSGENIYVYNVHNKKFYHKSADDKFEYLLGSGFSYFDLANLKFLDNFTPKVNGIEKNNGKQLLRIENIPLDKGIYSKINILVDHKDNYRLTRIDYYARDGVLLKSLKPTFNMLPLRSKSKKASEVYSSVKWEMVHMGYGSSSIYEFLLVDQSANLNAALFDKQNIEK